MGFYWMLLIVFVLSLIFVAVLMPFFIQILKNHNIAQEVSEYALDEYKQKAKTPIMGGLLFVVCPLVIFLAADLPSALDKRMQFILLSYLLYCLVGFWDDMTIIMRHNNLGLTPLFKLILEFIFTVVLYIIYHDIIATYIHIPYFNIDVDLSFFYIPLMIMMFLAEANAVNFTDGMDGLCASVSFIALSAFALIAFFVKEYDICIFIVAVLGALVAYLFYNWHPAQIFMGDSGSLALGALFASLAVVLKQEILLFIIGGVFVWEMFCVCLQQIWVRLFHKRVFSYTPIHYAFTLKGYKETKVVALFCFIAFLLACGGLAVFFLL